MSRTRNTQRLDYELHSIQGQELIIKDYEFHSGGVSIYLSKGIVVSFQRTGNLPALELSFSGKHHNLIIFGEKEIHYAKTLCD